MYPLISSLASLALSFNLANTSLGILSKTLTCLTLAACTARQAMERQVDEQYLAWELWLLSEMLHTAQALWLAIDLPPRDW
jgi:hypothetical protein